jgi:eukaryotic-like serine/threonine-protein kinase
MSPAQESAADLVGTVLGGSYSIARLIGEGGMGAVYEAMHVRLGKPIAVKLMSRDLASNQEALARFRREAQVASHLGHPHLVNVIDFGTSEAGEPYLVMEYLDGEDLDHRLRRVGRLPLDAAVGIAKQVASALAAAHDEGIVHRDLKPANVYLVNVRGEADFVKVLDFGISKIKAARTKLTKATAIIGTPEYMPPEQANGMIDEIDHRADQWSLGCMVWEMLSGRPPFVADDVSALFYQLLNLDPQPLSKRVPDLPPGVEAVLRRALAKRMEDRFSSMRDFARALEAAASGRQVDLTPALVTVPKTLVDHGAVREDRPTPTTVDPEQIAKDEIPAASGDDTGGSEGFKARTWSRPIYLVPFAVAVVLVGALLLFRSRVSAPVAAPIPAPLSVAKTPEKSTTPTAAPVIAEPPPPAPSALPEPEPPARSPKSKSANRAPIDTPSEPEPPVRSPKSKSAKSAPIGPDQARPKPSASPSEPKPSLPRPIIEDL